jgi:hypothetical protein
MTVASMAGHFVKHASRQTRHAENPASGRGTIAAFPNTAMVAVAIGSISETPLRISFDFGGVVDTACFVVAA